MRSLNIVIVHDDSRIREYVSLQALSLSPAHRVFSHDGQSFYQSPEWKYGCARGEQDALNATAFDLAIAHAGNRTEAETLEPKRLVLFGGHGEAGDPRANGCEYIYQDIYGKVTRGELLEIFGPLVPWCQVGDRPWFLDPPDSPAEYSISLSLLCQGYLAHHAGSPENRGDAGIDTKGCANVGKALKTMGWVEDEAATVVSQTVKDFDLSPSESLLDADFWRSLFEGKSLRQGLEEECRSLRKNVQNKIQNGMLVWLDSATMPSQIGKLVEAIENATKKDEKREESANNKKLFDEDFICVVARAYLELNILLEAA